MIATIVQDLTEELKRFDPRARLEFEIEVDGISTHSRCTVTQDTSEIYKELNKALNFLEDCQAEGTQLRRALRDIKRSMEDGKSVEAQKLKAIEAHLEAVEEYL